MDGRTLILSDLHLGGNQTRLEEPAQLQTLWADVDHVIFNGDSFELGYAPEVSTTMFHRLKSMLEDSGIRYTFITGNHDPEISKKHWLRLYSGRVFITHGDMLDARIAPWSVHANQMKGIVERHVLQIISDQSQASMETELEALAMGCRTAAMIYWSKEGERYRNVRAGFDPKYWFKNPIKPLRVIKYWLQVQRKAEQFASRYAADCSLMVYGHSHRQALKRYGKRWVVNTGAHSFPAKPWGVLIEDHQWEIRKIVLKHGEARWGRQVKVCPW